MSTGNYTFGIPNISPAQDQPAMLKNTNTLGNTYDIDHVSYNSPINTGFHNFVTMPIQSAVPTANSSAPRLVCLDDANGNPQIFVQSPANSVTGQNALMQLTAWNPTGTGLITDSTGTYTDTSIANVTIQSRYTLVAGGIMMILCNIILPASPSVGLAFNFKNSSGNIINFSSAYMGLLVPVGYSGGLVYNAVQSLPIFSSTLSTTVLGLYTNGAMIETTPGSGHNTPNLLLQVWGLL